MSARTRITRLLGWARAAGAAVVAGFPALALLTSVILGERFEAARRTIQSIRDVAGDRAADTAAPGFLAPIWLGFAIAGTAVAILVTYDVCRGMHRRWPAGSERRRAATRTMALVIALAAVWSFWSLTGSAAVEWPSAAWLTRLRSLAHSLGLVLLIVAIAGGLVAGGLRKAWRRASAVRVEILALSFVFAAVLALPVTAEQASDVFRAWSDEGVEAIVGVAGALLLGAVARNSASRLLRLCGSTGAPPTMGVVAAQQLRGGDARTSRAAPESARSRRQARRLTWPRAALAAVLVGAAIVGVTRGYVGLAAVAVLLLARVVTDDATPGAQKPLEADLDQLARLLGCLPLLTVFAGLTDAGVESFLLVGHSRGRDWALAGITAALSVILAAQIGFARHMRWRGIPSPRLPAFVPATVAASVTSFAGPGIAAAAVIATAVGSFWPALAGAAALLTVALLVAFARDGTLGLRTGLVTAATVAAMIYIRPLEASDALGMVGITMAAVAGGLGLLHLAATAGRRRRPRPPLDRLLPSSVPVVSLMAAWIAAAFFTGTSSMHQARTIDGQAGYRTIGGAVSHWLNRQRDTTPGAANLTMLLVGASGGGAKAAYWTDLVLDCAFGSGSAGTGTKPDECEKAPTAAKRMSELFLTSSVSGGSVGVYHYLSHLSQVANGVGWVDGSAGRDALSPVVAWGLFHDAPAFMLGKLPGVQMNPTNCSSGWNCRWNADRAVVQEAAVAGDWADLTPPDTEPSATVLAGTDGGVAPPGPNGDPSSVAKYAPVAIFNGALDGSVGRLLMSPLDLAPTYDQTAACLDMVQVDVPGGLDARDVLTGRRQLPLVTAALLSARFPVVEPPGRVGTTTDENADQTDGCDITPPVPAVRVRDGGYVENSGLLTIVDLLPSIERSISRWQGKHPQAPTVRIVVLSIDDDSAVLCPNPNLSEKKGGFGLATQAGPDYLTRIVRDKLNAGRFPDVTYLRISPPPSVGAHAATGWELSRTARERQLQAALRPGVDGHPTPALRNLDILRTLLDDGNTPAGCAAPS